MKKSVISFLLSVLICVGVCATEQNQDLAKIFENAMNEYSNNNFEAALNGFNKIISQDKGYDNFQVNFNLGACYFKLGKFGEARFYFERALNYNPFDKDLEHNLKVIYNKILDDPELASQEIIGKKFLYFVSSKVLIIIVSLFTLLAVICIVIFVSTKGKFKFLWLVSSACIIISLGAFVFFGLQKMDYNKVVYVVKSETTNVYLSPTDKDSILMTISVGAKGQITDKMGAYIKTKMPDGSSGWIRRADLIASDEL